jgi:hypothetical protein
MAKPSVPKETGPRPTASILIPAGLVAAFAALDLFCALFVVVESVVVGPSESMSGPGILGAFLCPFPMALLLWLEYLAIVRRREPIARGVAGIFLFSTVYYPIPLVAGILGRLGLARPGPDRMAWLDIAILLTLLVISVWVGLAHLAWARRLKAGDPALAEL